MANVYDYWNEIGTFESQTPSKQKEILDMMLDRDTLSSYRYNWALSRIVPCLPDIDAFNLLEFGLQNTSSRHYVDDLHELMIKMHEKDSIKTIALFSKAHLSGARRMLLSLPSFNIDEEIIGLRALSETINTPNYIYEAKYMPSLEALKKIPTIMRLKVLETMLNIHFIGYNIFEKITDQEEFRSLLFGSLVKYQERVEIVWKKYLEMMVSGTPGVISVKAECSKCGEYEVKINSSVIHTSVKLKETRLSRLLNNHWCAICGSNLKTPPSVKENE